MADIQPTIAYLFTTFPKSTETFLQREVAGLRKNGAQLRLYSLWGGGGEFEGMPVATFNKWKLLMLVWIIPWVAITRWDVFGILLRGLLTRRPPSWLNFWENMLGAGFVAVFYRKFRSNPPALVHAAWGGAPATAAWCLARMNGLRYSAAAHAYDIYEHGGDWWLDEKLTDARFVHTSTEMGEQSLMARGLSADRVHVVRRGLVEMPACKALRSPRTPLRIVSIGRLVEKKGFEHQLRIYAQLRRRGFAFEAHVIGDGPLKSDLGNQAAALGLSDVVSFRGHLPQVEVWCELAWADVLLHTGIVAPSGDRDGLPNVIPEAMAAGVLVVTSPAAATTEAISHEATGLVANVENPDEWMEALQRLSGDDALADRLRRAARSWVETNFDAGKNTARLHQLLKEAAKT